MAEQDDVTMCGICSRNGELAVRVARWGLQLWRPMFARNFGHHPVGVFSIAGETQWPAEKPKPQ
jgi:hypothetical protein